LAYRGSPASISDRFDIGWGDIALWSSILLAEAVAVLIYLDVTDTSILEPRYIVYPFVWINVGIFAVSRTSLPETGNRLRRLLLAATGIYLMVLLYLGGVLRLGVFTPIAGETAVRVDWAVPGWGPVVVFRNTWIQATVIPYKVVGYLSFTYLLYAKLLSGTKGAASGVLGLVSCVGCTFSILIPVFGAVGFGWITELSVDLSTAVFLLTIGLLYWSEVVETALSARFREIWSAD
jgi:hypothetical protein